MLPIICMANRRLKSLISSESNLRLIADSKKSRANALRTEGGRVVVFRRFIAGAWRIFKASPHEILQKVHLANIYLQHEVARRSGKIICDNYLLHRTPYRVVSPFGSVRKEVSGIGIDKLLYFRKDPKVQAFLHKFPQLTHEKLFLARLEIEDSLRYLFGVQKIPSIDPKNEHIIVKGVDKKSGKVIVSVIDQIAPSHEREVQKFYHLLSLSRNVKKESRTK